MDGMLNVRGVVYPMENNSRATKPASFPATPLREQTFAFERWSARVGDLPTSLRVDACRLVDGRALTTTRGKNPRNRLWFRWCHLGIV